MYIQFVTTGRNKQLTTLLFNLIFRLFPLDQQDEGMGQFKICEQSAVNCQGKHTVFQKRLFLWKTDEMGMGRYSRRPIKDFHAVGIFWMDCS